MIVQLNRQPFSSLFYFISGNESRIIYQNFTVFRFLSTSIQSYTIKQTKTKKTKFCLRFALNLIVISSASPSK